jgi:hypothetical protein
MSHFENSKLSVLDAAVDFAKILTPHYPAGADKQRSGH